MKLIVIIDHVSVRLVLKPCRHRAIISLSVQHVRVHNCDGKFQLACCFIQNSSLAWMKVLSAIKTHEQECRVRPNTHFWCFSIKEIPKLFPNNAFRIKLEDCSTC